MKLKRKFKRNSAGDRTLLPFDLHHQLETVNFSL